MPHRAVILLVAFATMLVHARAKWGSFVFHDDYRYVVNNQEIDHVGNPVRFFTDLSTLAPQSPTRDIYRPVRTLSYAIVTAIAGKERAAPFHVLAILLHVGTTVLLLLLLQRAGLGAFPSAAGALFFGLHPVTAEVTAWVCSLGDSWCGLLALASVLAYAADRRILALAALVVALFSKEHAVVVPGLWLLWDACVRPERLRAGAWRRTVLVGAAPAAAVVVAFLAFRSGYIGARTSQVDERIGGSYPSAACTMVAGLGWYAATILLPYSPTFDAVVEVRDTPFDVGVLLGVLVIAALLWAVFRGPSRVRLGAAWFLVALIPVNNVFISLKIPTADRFLYLPLMGISFLVGELAQRTLPFAAKWMTPALVLLGVLAVARIGDWSNSDALAEAGLRVDPKSHRLIWAKAATTAEKALMRMRDGDVIAARQLGAEAVAGYTLYLRNSYPAEQTQAYVELGDLLDGLGRGGERGIREDALRAYMAARDLQVRGIGRTTEEEIRHVAEQIVRLAIDLGSGADSPADVIEAGGRAAAFLRERYGVDDTGSTIFFRLADAVRVRGQEPAKARETFDWVLDTVARLEAEGARQTTAWSSLLFARAQARFYRAVLRDREFDRAAIERAYEEYVEASRYRIQTLRALFYAARCKCTIGDLFDDEQATEQGRQLLAAIPTIAAEGHLPLDDWLRTEIVSLEAGCGR